MKLKLRVVKLKNAIMINILVFVGGCLLTLSLLNVPTQGIIDSSSYSIGSLKKYEKYSVNYVTIILTAPDNEDRRDTIRQTWLNLAGINFNNSSPDENVSVEFKHFFVIGTAGIGDNKLKQLEKEQTLHNDILFLPNFADKYSSLTKKLLLTFRWLDVTFPNLLYMLKCDDDSFVRTDIFFNEFNERKKRLMRNSLKKPLDGVKEDKFYWGYFKGNAHVRLKGKWAEPDWILCDRYLPYALGGGYVLSKGIIHFIAKNSDDLQIYKSEDATIGVWTAPLSNVNRVHDTRFDTEWTSRGCEDSFIVRHKQSPEEMKEMYANLMKSRGKTMCTEVTSIRQSYIYNWEVLPSSCCNRQ